MSYLEVIKKCDSVPYYSEKEYKVLSEACYKFMSHDGAFLGWILPIVAKELLGFDKVIKVDESAKTVTMSPELDNVSERSEVISRIVNNWRKQKTFKVLEGWRDELYSVYNPTHEVYLFIERSAACLFGVVTYGVHIVGYVPAAGPKEEMKIWVPKRSLKKATNPGMLDNTVAGGIGYPHGIFETVLKECYEEAGLEEQYVRSHIKEAGVVSYNFRKESVVDNELGVFQPEVEYVYDLVMDNSIEPKPVDGEVHEFYLMTVSEVKEAILTTDKFKYNCALVQIDFFIRHGLIKPDEEPDYLEIVNRSHRKLDHPTM